ncbi:caspase family protein [Moorena producens JHB]|uniref:Caspase family protein n=1 Tax=Moorena producens (strain JHB) TaxID=1454205 RepID=A0A1D9FZF6_MOOP1|nr:caspase family protein [Moorena producens]AOY80747.1 caspase family protein [Moorena producens JHB]
MIGTSPKNLAVLVGINAYGNGIPSLKTPVNDTVALGEVLKNSYNYDVKLLLDSEATLPGINQLLDNLKDGILTLSEHRIVKVKSYQRFLFYFAGHGITEDAFENQDGLTGYLIPQDAQKSDKSTFLSMKQLSDVLVEIKCHHLLVILDCCFAGAFPSARNVAPPEKLYREQYDRFMTWKAQQMIASAAYDEQALDVLTRLGQREDNNNGKNSPFAEALLQGLQVNKMSNGKVEAKADSIPDGVITAYELISYIDYELAKRTDKQTPGLFTLKHHHKGQYVFPIPGFKPDQLEKAPPLDKSTNPYRGLEPYKEQDSKLFFGREQVIRNLVNHVCDATKPPLTVVLGVSGSGKSSLVKAGLIPNLLNKKKEQWQILEPKRPQALINALATDNQQQISKNWQLTPQRLIEKLGADNYNTSKKLLLVIDQFEELVTQCSQEEKKQLLYALKQLLTNYSDQVQVVITLRSEFEPQLTSDFLSIRKEVVLFAIILMIIEKLYKFIPILSQIYHNYLAQKQWMAARFLVPAMTQDEFREVIEKPALEKVLYFEPPELVDKLINEVLGMPGALPLLSFTLSQLYLKYLERRSDNRAMTQEDYNQLGGVMGALKTSTTQVYNDLVQKDSSYEQTIRHVMLRMVAVGGGEVARRAVPASELKYRDPEENKRVKKVVDCFLEKRLLVSGTDAEGNVYYEPAHDAFILGWGQLLEWKREKQENLLLQRRLTPAAMEWKTIEQFPNKAEPFLNLWNQGLDLTYNSFHFIKTQITRLVRWNSQTPKSDKKSKFLWDSNPRLNLLEEVLKSSDSWLSETEAEFVESSIKQSRRTITTRWSIAFGVILVLILGIIVIDRQRRNAEITAIVSTLESRLVSQEESLDLQLESIALAKELKNSKNGKWLKHEILIRGINVLRQLVYQKETKLYNQIDGHDELTSIEAAHRERVSGALSVAFIPRTNLIASATGDGKVKLWQPDGTLVNVLEGYPGAAQSIAVSHDGELIASAYWDNRIKLRRNNGSLVKTITEHRCYVASMAFSPDKKLIASASCNNTVKLWRADGSLKNTFAAAHEDMVNSVAFSPDGKLIASGSSDRTIKLWRTDGSAVKTLAGHSNWVESVAFSPDAKLIASASMDGTVKLWKLDGTILITLKGHTDGVNSVAFSPDGKLIASGSSDRTIKLWKYDGTLITTLEGHPGAVESIAFSPDGNLIASAADNTVKLWKFNTVLTTTLKSASIAFSPDGNLIAYTTDNNTIELRRADDSFVATLEGHHVVFSPDSKLIASASDNNVKLWKSDGSLENTFTGHQGKVKNVAFSPKDKLIVSTDDENIKLWNLDGSLKDTITRKHPYVRVIAFSPDGKMIASGGDNYLKLWSLDIESPQPISLRHEPSSPLYRFSAIAFSPNDNLIASASGNNTIQLWRYDGSPVQTLDQHLDEVRSVVFSHDGKLIASASNDGTVKLWTSDGKFIRNLEGHTDRVNSVTFTSDDNLIVSGGSDDTVKLWAVDGSLLANMEGHQGDITKVVFSKTNNLIASASEDQTIRIWDFNLESLLRHSCNWVHDYLNNPNANLSDSDRALCKDIVNSQ